MASPTRRKLVAVCPPGCSVDEAGPAIGAVVIDMREAYPRVGQTLVWRRISALGYKGHENSVGRHLKHLREESADESEPAEGSEKVGDLAILDSIIAAGYRNSKHWKPTIRDTLEAMKLKATLTGNSVFDDMLAAMNSAMDGDFEPEEAPEAVFAPDERPAEEDELPEPVL